MSHAIMVPMTGQGTIIDTNIDDVVSALSNTPFNFSDVFLYSHGWWTTADAAIVDYARFSTGFAAIVTASAQAPASALEIGVHWPSMVSEDGDALANIVEPFSFFNRAQMADIVGQHGGYCLIRLILEARKATGSIPRFHLLGHSFGAKVVCAALQFLAADAALSELLAGVQFNVVLLQGAFDNNAFEAGQAYAAVLPKFPHLRLLVTKSSLDAALDTAYLAAHKLVNLFSDLVPAIGAAGPSTATFNQLGGTNLSVRTGCSPTADSLAGRLVVADLTLLHQSSAVPSSPFTGHHCDIYHDEIFRLIAGFLFGAGRQ